MVNTVFEALKREQTDSVPHTCEACGFEGLTVHE